MRISICVLQTVSAARPTSESLEITVFHFYWENQNTVKNAHICVLQTVSAARPTSEALEITVFHFYWENQNIIKNINDFCFDFNDISNIKIK